MWPSSLILVSVLLRFFTPVALGHDDGRGHRYLSSPSNTSGLICTSPKGSSRSERRKRQLEERYRQQVMSSETLDSEKVTLLFGHVHHAGGTAICLLARQNTITNPKDNCNHPQEFKGPPPAPSSGSISEQVAFQRSSPWQFYSVELQMPRHIKYNGPFIYGAILRNPYILLMSQFRRSQVKFQFKGDLIDLVHLQLTYVGVTNVNFRQHMTYLQQQSRTHEGLIMKHKEEVSFRNFFRGQAGFLLGQFGPTNYSDTTIFNMAKRRLKRFSVLALTEYMVESGVVLGAKLNWRVDGFGQRVVNSNGEASQLVTDLKELSAEDQAFVRYYVGVDTRLYHYAQCLLEKEYHHLTNRTWSSSPYEELDLFFQLN